MVNLDPQDEIIKIEIEKNISEIVIENDGYITINVYAYEQPYQVCVRIEEMQKIVDIARNKLLTNKA